MTKARVFTVVIDRWFTVTHSLVVFSSLLMVQLKPGASDLCIIPLCHQHRSGEPQWRSNRSNH